MELLDYKEAAEILRCSPLTLRKRVMLHQVPHLKPFGPKGRVFFLRSDLEDFLLNSRKPANKWEMK
jgi:hypothetical protein